jgi:hypothetical protein
MGTVVGVAIATALMPPLAVVGFGLATLNWTVFSGALMLYVTNLLTIALTAMVMARLYGFRTSLSERQTQLQTVVVLVAFTGLAIPLGISLYKIAWEAQTTREIRGDVLDAFNGKARLSQFDIEYGTAPIQITVTVLTPNLRPDAENIVQRAAERALGKPAKVGITQYEVGTSAKAAEQAQLSAARAKQEAAAQQQRQQTENLVGQLALVAGVAPGDVVIDSDRRKALVTTKPLPGAGLAAYRALEQRVAASVPDWQVELTPPARALPDVGFANGEPTDAGKQAIALIQWAAQRIHAPLVLEGSKVNTDRLAALLGAKAVETSARVTWRHPDSVKVSWGTPGGG